VLIFLDLESKLVIHNKMKNDLSHSNIFLNFYIFLAFLNLV